MKKGLAVVIVLLIMVSGVFAGGKAEAMETAAQEVSEGPVRVIIPQPTRVTPGFLTDGAGAIFASCVYDWMFRINGETGKVEPSLVETYEVTPDGKVWTFRLRKGVKFHHGPEMTADDVIFTVGRWTDEDSGSPLNSVFADLISRVEEVDSHTVKIHLTRTDVDFNLKLLDFNAAILARDYDYDNLGETRPSGTGAFKVDNYSPRERVSLVANREYWLQGVPYIENLEIIFITELETQIRMLEARQADVVTDISVDHYRRLETNNQTSGMYIELGHHVPIAMRVDQEPFNDVRVRQALKYVIDREQLLESVMYGLGSLGNDTPIGPFHPYYDDLGGIRKRDVQKAKDLLAEAGYKDGLKLVLYTETNVPPVMDIVLAVQQMALDANINIEIRGTTRDMYYAEYWLPSTFKATLWGHREDITQLLNLRYKCGAAWNEGHYCNPELDRYVELASSEVDPKKRQEYFSKIQQLLHDNGPDIVAFFQPYFGGTSDRITDFYLTRNWINDYRFIKLK